MEVVTTAVNYPGKSYFIGDQEPKYIRDELEYVVGMFIMKVERLATETAPASIFWHYYPLKVSAEQKGNFYRIEVSPVVVGDGYVCINDQIFHVPVGDLVRRRINVTRIAASRRSPSNTNSNTSTNTSATAPAPRGNSYQPSPSDVVEPEVREAIDLAFQEQIEALQYFENIEERAR
jgi:hypothetical protein